VSTQQVGLVIHLNLERGAGNVAMAGCCYSHGLVVVTCCVECLQVHAWVVCSLFVAGFILSDGENEVLYTGLTDQ